MVSVKISAPLSSTSRRHPRKADPLPEDTRFQKRDVRKESPTVRTDDPRQQTYAYRSAADVIAREMNTSRPLFPESVQSAPNLPQDDVQNKPGAHSQRFEIIPPSENWNQCNMATLAGLNAFTDSEKISAINSANNRQMDSEMADQSANSRGPTPQSSSGYNHSSSNTSYSPSQAHDDVQSTPGIGGGGNFMREFAPQSHNSSTPQQEDAFKISAGWDMGAGLSPGQGMTPASLTGMTPDGGWEKLMDSMGWETGRTG